MYLFFKDTATTEIYTLSLHDALPICNANNLVQVDFPSNAGFPASFTASGRAAGDPSKTTISGVVLDNSNVPIDRKSTRLNSSHANISYAVFCLKKNTHQLTHYTVYHF